MAPGQAICWHGKNLKKNLAEITRQKTHVIEYFIPLCIIPFGINIKHERLSFYFWHYCP